MSYNTAVKYKQFQSKSLVNRGYVITGHIGEGSFGIILMARSKRHHCQMAIKVINKPPENEKNDCIYYWCTNNEKQFAYKFDHPYINAYYEIIETTKRFYFVMNYYKNGTLMEYYNEVNYTPESLAYEWFAQLCAALEYVHGSHFAHRDIKMENVLLDHQRRVRLSDFGMCVAVRRPCRTDVCDCVGGGEGGVSVPSIPVINRSVCGSVQYMSPELLAHGPYNGQLADVWAAGVLLYCLLVGRFPFTVCNNGENDPYLQIKLSQKKGYGFEQNELQRLSKECRLIFKNIFVTEIKRKEISELKQDDWIIKMSQTIKVPYYTIH